mmetsp:Transcript_23445/g.92920  ORF Transcript_23445/g.92920 Transcript_23445/m.92920 type:complete len:125 (+) Transcript_23445:461-835(+)
MHANATSKDGLVMVTTSKYINEAVSKKQFDRVRVETPDFTFVARTMVAQKYEMAEEQESFLHVDWDFKTVPDPKALDGFLAATLYESVPMTPEYAAMLKEPTLTDTAARLDAADCNDVVAPATA